MRLKSVRIKNFRGINSEGVSFALPDLTSLVGRNDAGKSTILDALDIFFNGNEACSPLSYEDVNLLAHEKNPGECINIEIACTFSDLPQRISLDCTEKTSFADEGMLNVDNELEIIKIFPDARKEEVYLSAQGFEDGRYAKIFTMDNSGLKAYAKSIVANCKNLKSNVKLRASIRKALAGSNQRLEKLEIAGDRWEMLKALLPEYALFRSDRENGTNDVEIKSPIMMTVKRAFESPHIRKQLSDIAGQIRTNLESFFELVKQTMISFDCEMIKNFHLSMPTEIKWWNLFKEVSLQDERQVSLDKRGSGVRRLALISSFMAYAKSKTENERGIIYAIEEPETALHSDVQAKMVDALKKNSYEPNTQIIITTHSGQLLKCLYGKNDVWKLYSDCTRPDIKIVVNTDGQTRINETSSTGIYDGILPYLSYAEISYLLLGDCLLEYHEELYGFLEVNGLAQKCNDYVMKMSKRGLGDVSRKYSRREKKFGEYGLPMFVRDMIHHPENDKRNTLAERDIKSSVFLMRQFMQEKGFQQIEYNNAALRKRTMGS